MTMLKSNIVKNMIQEGKNLFISGNPELLKMLPCGNWIAGTIPYFMTEDGGKRCDDELFVTELPEYVTSAVIKTYTADTLKNVYLDGADNGFSLIVIPAGSSTHLSFAIDSADYPEFASRSLVGWISGVPVEEIGVSTPYVFDGTTGKKYDNGAVVMHVGLPNNKYAVINILNSFAQGNGDTIQFVETGFNASKAIVNGKECNFTEYLIKNNVDIRLPLVADYNGAMINTSFQKVDSENNLVSFYAPVFNDLEYKVAAPTKLDYLSDFSALLNNVETDKIFWSCNCILNYLYAGLEGKHTGQAYGPMTFGEVAYQLVNQTMVYLSIFDH